MIRAYQALDNSETNGWRVAHGEQPISHEFLPPVGFIEPGVAAGFMYQTDGGFSLFESFVTNPAAPRDERHKALNDIISALEHENTRLGYKIIVAFTQSDSIGERALTHGFKAVGNFKLFTKEV